MRIDVAPGADHAATGYREVLEHARNRVRIAVGPAAEGQDRAGDGGIIFLHRAVFPIGIIALVRGPERRKERQRVDAGQPVVAPAVAHDLGIERAGLIGQHDRAPPEVVVQQAAAHEMDVVAEPVVGEIDRDHCLEFRRPAGGDLQAVEPAPAFPHHPDIAAAPILRRDPGQHLKGVVLLLAQVFVGQVPVRIPRPAHVHTDRGIAVFGKIAVHRLVPRAGAVALAVGDIFQHSRDAAVLRPFGEPDARAKAAAVRQGDPDMLKNFDPHGAALSSCQNVVSG